MTDLREKKRIAFFRGHSAERFASVLLLLKGFRIVARRYRTRLGEIDLIARRGNLVLIVEVKARSSLERAYALTKNTQVKIDLAAAQRKAGKIKPIAALGAQRLALLPEVPTVAESGFPGFDMSTWFAFLAPAGLPEPVRAKLEAALADVMAQPATQQKLESIGLTPAWGNGSALKARVERELPLMRDVAQRAQIEVE